MCTCRNQTANDYLFCGCGLREGGRLNVFVCEYLYIRCWECTWHLVLTVSLLTNVVFTPRQQCGLGFLSTYLSVERGLFTSTVEHLWRRRFWRTDRITQPLKDVSADRTHVRSLMHRPANCSFVCCVNGIYFLVQSEICVSEVAQQIFHKIQGNTSRNYKKCIFFCQTSDLQMAKKAFVRNFVLKGENCCLVDKSSATWCNIEHAKRVKSTWKGQKVSVVFAAEC